MRKQIEATVLISAVILCLWSIIAVLSATLNSPGYASLYVKQAAAFALGMGALLVLRLLPYRILDEISPLLYSLALLMLVYLVFAGVRIHGSRRWISLGLFNFQPSEFAKIAVILLAARILRRHNNFIYSLMPVAAAAFLITIQPDAGTAVVFFPVYAAMLAISRINTRIMFVSVPYLVIAAAGLLGESYLNANSKTLLNLKYLIYPTAFSLAIYFVFHQLRKINKNIKPLSVILVILFVWFSLGAGIGGAYFLKGYQKKRIVSFLMPNIDPLGAGYNTRQSLTAVGSGRIAGKGLFGGTQTQLGFLPVQHTDFIFASIVEETGLVGSLAILFVIGLLLWQFIRIIERTEDYGARLISCGIFTLFFTQVFINLGVVLGLLPVIGIQLPLVSYGGTGMVMFLSMIGIMLNINSKTEIIGR
jgi:rod shape determining protein RodA